VKKPEEVMEVLEAYDLAGNLRGAGQLAGCDHQVRRALGGVARPRDGAEGRPAAADDARRVSAEDRRARGSLERPDPR
jgi:hypothetical protein